MGLLGHYAVYVVRQRNLHSSLNVFSPCGHFAGRLLPRRTPSHFSPGPPTRNYRSGIGGRHGSCVRTHPTQFNFVSYRMPTSVVNRTDFAALVHTFPFIVYNVRWGQMEARYAASAEYWTGIACLVPMVNILVYVLDQCMFSDRVFLVIVDMALIHVRRPDKALVLRIIQEVSWYLLVMQCPLTKFLSR